jgi:hypothetical protein
MNADRNKNASRIESAFISFQMLARPLPVTILLQHRGHFARSLRSNRAGIAMKQSIFTFVLLSGAAFAADKTFTGEIMDSQCADMASHDNMMKGENAHNAKECTIACVKKGGTYALYVPEAKQAYKLDNQKKAAAFAGQKVTVTGSVSSSGDSIKVATIAAQ